MLCFVFLSHRSQVGKWSWSRQTRWTSPWIVHELKCWPLDHKSNAYTTGTHHMETYRLSVYFKFSKFLFLSNVAITLSDLHRQGLTNSWLHDLGKRLWKRLLLRLLLVQFQGHTGVESTLAPPTILHSGCMGLVCLATDYGKNDAFSTLQLDLTT